MTLTEKDRIKYTPQQLFVTQVMLVFLPDLGRVVNDRRNMISAEVAALKEPSIVGIKETVDRMQQLYLQRESQRSSLERKHGWHECNPYTFPFLLHVELTVEIGELLRSEEHRAGIIDVLKWVEACPHNLSVTVQHWSKSNFDDARNRTVKIELLNDDRVVMDVKTIILGMKYIWDLVSVIALNEELEKIQSDIEVTKAQSNLIREETRPLPIDKAVGGAAITMEDTEENIICDEVIEDDVRIPFRPEHRQELIKYFLKLAGKEKILSKQDILYWLRAEFQGFRPVSENRIIRPKTEKGIIIFFIRQLYMKYEESRKLMSSYREMLQRRISLCNGLSREYLKAHFSDPAPAKFPLALIL